MTGNQMAVRAASYQQSRHYSCGLEQDKSKDLRNTFRLALSDRKIGVLAVREDSASRLSVNHLTRTA